MPTFAFVKDNVVVEVKKDPQEIVLQLLGSTHQIIDITSAVPKPDVGWTYDGAKLNPPADFVISDMRITKLGFRQRFTLSEMTTIYNALSTNTMLKILMDNLSIATFVDLARSDTIQGVYYIASQGLITMERATQILTTPPSASEHYKD